MNFRILVSSFTIGVLAFLAHTSSAQSRVTSGQQVLYSFGEGSGSTVFDNSGVGSPLNLTIADPGAVTWLVGGGLSIDAPTVLTSTVPAAKIIAAAQSSNAITLETWVVPANTNQFGPARIVALSQGSTSGANFVLGPGPGSADVTKYDARLKTTSTSKHGTPSLSTGGGIVTTSLQHLVFTRAGSGERRIFVDGSEVVSGSVQGTFANWGNFVLTLANDVTADRAWLGSLHLVAIYDRALTPAEVVQNFNAGLGTQTDVPPSIVAHPDGQSVLEGEVASFAVAASGTEPLSYQWQLFDVPTSTWLDIAGAIGTGYTTPATILADDGSRFRCVVTNTVDSATSDEAILTVSPVPPDVPPFLTSQPAAQNVFEGQSASFSVSASGTDPLSYQWQLFDVPTSTWLDIAGAVGTDYNTPATVLADDGARFRCVVTNVAGSATSDEAILTVSESVPNRVTADQQVLYRFDEGSGNTVGDVAGAGVPLDLTIDNPAAVSWLPGGGLSVNSPTVLTSTVAAAKVKSAAQASSEITVEAWVAPANTTQFGPARIVALSQGSTAGSNFVLGPGPGATQSTHYDVRLRTTSTSKYGAPSLNSASGVVSSALQHVVYSRDALGTARIYVDGTPVGNGTVNGSFANWGNFVLTLANEPTVDRPWLGELYLVAIYSRALSEAEVLQNLNAGPDGGSPPTGSAPGILAHPTNLSVEETQAASFFVTADGSVPLSFQWQRYNQGSSAWDDIPAADGTSYTTPPTTLADDGAQFRCVVTNTFGSATSNDALLTVTPLPPGGGIGSTRVTEGQQVVYSFSEGTGNTVFDQSDVGTPLDLTIADPGAVAWLPGSGLAINSETVLTTTVPATRLSDAAKASNAITLEAWIVPGNVDQWGPSRILALSESSNKGGNFVVGVGPSSTQTSAYDVRLKTTQTSKYGTPSLSTPNDVVVTALQHVVYTREATGASRIYVDGVEVANRTVSGNFSNWGDRVLTVANEPTVDRGWLGELHLIAVYDRALSPAEVVQNFDAGAGIGPVVILAHPESQEVIESQEPSFTVSATGAGPITAQWQRFNQGSGFWEDIPGAQAAVYTLPPTVLADDGSRFRCVLTNFLSSETTAEAVLSVLPISTPLNLTVTAIGNGDVTLVPDQPTYLLNDVVTLTANPDNTDSAFLEWSGDLTSILDAQVVTMTGHKAVTATFADVIPDPIPAPIAKTGVAAELVDVMLIPRSDTHSPELGRARLNIMRSPPDASGRLFVNDMRGKLHIIENGTLLTYADLAVIFPNFTGAAMGRMTGFVSFAFHPNFASNGKFYTAHNEVLGSAPADLGEAPIPGWNPVQGVVTEWTASNPSANTFSGTRRELLRLDHPSDNHPITDIGFNPNLGSGASDYGNLYIMVGDGNAFGFGVLTEHVSLGSMLGKIFRIDPSGTNGRNGMYGIPSDNPYAFDGDPNTLDEVWASGFRDPHRLSWDTGGNHRMIITDVGQGNMEEINLGVVGADYGWPLREGTFLFNPKGSLLKVFPRPSTDEPFSFTYPVAEYDHDEGFAISGGFVYRGSAIPELVGKYIFGDIVVGRVFYVDAGSLALGSLATIYELTLTRNGVEMTLPAIVGNHPPVNAGRADLRVAIDKDGEIYILTKTDGMVRKLVPVPPGNMAGTVEIVEAGELAVTLELRAAEVESTVDEGTAASSASTHIRQRTARLHCLGMSSCSQELSRDVKDGIRGEGTVVGMIQFQRASDGNPIALDWSGMTFSAGDFYLIDLTTGGASVRVDMKHQSATTVVDPAVSELLIVFAAKAASATAMTNPQGFGVLKVSDAAGGTQELLYGGVLDSTENPASYSLPPPPPQGAFDARFTGDSRLLQVDEGVIRVQSSNYPLQIAVTHEPDTLGSVWLIDELPVGLTHDLSVESSFSVSNPAVNRFRLHRSASTVGLNEFELPNEFALRGNFPNPFSQTTTLVLDVPETAEIEVVLYDVLGRTAMRMPVTTVAGGANRRVVLDGGGLAAGVYMYRVRAHLQTRTVALTGRMTVVR